MLSPVERDPPLGQADSHQERLSGSQRFFTREPGNAAARQAAMLVPVNCLFSVRFHKLAGILENRLDR